MLALLTLFSVLQTLVSATPFDYDGRAPMNMTAADLDASAGPYLTVVKGSTENASHYATLLGDTLAPTPLWAKNVTEQALSITIDNSSIFIPGSGGPQNGFRRTDFIAQGFGSNSALDAVMEVNTSIFHVSIHQDEALPLNYTHEYQIVWIEPSDGSHVFEIQLGSPFTDPTGPLPVSDAHSLKVRDHALNLLYETPFLANTWHNFAVEVDWNKLTLAVYYSANASLLMPVTQTVGNPTASAGAAGQGDYHFGVLKLPLVDPSEPASEQSNVVYYGIQEGTHEGLIYSGIFVENAADGISVGEGMVSKMCPLCF